MNQACAEVVPQEVADCVAQARLAKADEANVAVDEPGAMRFDLGAKALAGRVEVARADHVVAHETSIGCGGCAGVLVAPPGLYKALGRVFLVGGFGVHLCGWGQCLYFARNLLWTSSCVVAVAAFNPAESVQDHTMIYFVKFCVFKFCVFRFFNHISTYEKPCMDLMEAKPSMVTWGAGPRTRHGNARGKPSMVAWGGICTKYWPSIVTWQQTPVGGVYFFKRLAHASIVPSPSKLSWNADFYQVKIEGWPRGSCVLYSKNQCCHCRC